MSASPRRRRRSSQSAALCTRKLRLESLEDRSLLANHAPSGTDKTITAREDTAYTITTADLGFTDTGDVPANTLAAVKITTLPTAGTLTDNGVAVAAGQLIAVADFTSSKVKFTAATNANGLNYARLTFQVQDNGGTAGGGIDLDPTPNTLTFNVTSINDAPAGTNTTVTTLEDTPYTFTAADFGFTDPNDSPANNLTAVKIATLPTAGTLTNNGVTVTAGASVTAANISSGLLRYTPVANANGLAYRTFTFQVQDNGGTTNGGVDLDASANTMTINVTAVNDAPAGTNKTVTTLEDTAYTFTAADFGLSDTTDSPANTLLAVKISTLPAVGTLTKSGAAVTAGDFVSAVDIAAGLFKFTPVANANGATYATFTFQVQDNGGTANGGVDLDQSANTITVAVTLVNDAPTGTDKTITALEDTAYTLTAADFGFSDPTDVPANALAAVKIATLPTVGTLANNGVAVTAGQVIVVADITAGRLKFTAAANANGAGYATLTFQVQDNGGVANGGVNLDPSPHTLTFDVTSINDAPAGTNTTVTTLEDTPYTFTTADFGFTDPNDNPANNLTAVKITTLPTAGTLTNNGVTVTAGASVTAANISSGLLRYTPVANANGAAYRTFTFQVQDDGGTANGGINLDASANTITINVTAVNDAPAGTNKTVTTLEDTAYTFTVADFGFSDATDSPANALLAVEITSLPTAGVLTNNGVAVVGGDFISADDIAAGLLKFMPAANANGATYTTFTFQVQDNGGTANGGVDLDQSPNTITVAVTLVNDAPTGTDKTITALEDTAYTLTTADFGFADPIDVPGNALAAVKITTLPTAGTMVNNGVAVTVGQVVTAANITSGLLKFTAAANANGANYTSLTFQVQDNGGVANGGIDLDPTPNTLTFNVTGINDAPAGANTTVTTLEDTPYTFTTADFGFTDPNDSPGNNLTAVKITTLPTAGTLTNNGVSVSTGQVVSAANIASGLLRYAPVANANGAAYRTFTFQVQDDGGTASGGIDLDASANTLTINVTAVNDAPAGTNKTVTTLEDAAYTFTAADFGFSDAIDTPANTLLAVMISTLPSAGTLTNNGVAVVAGDFISVADIAGGFLKFTPAANANSATYTTFTFQVQDNGGTANGGVDLDQSPNTITVAVTPVNDAPTGSDKTVTALEDTAYTLTTADFGFSDPSDVPTNALAAVKITTLPSTGTLTDNGVAVTAGQLIVLADFTSSKVKFTAAANANGANYGSLTFQVQDNGGVANGGVNLDPTPHTLTFDVTAVNDAPAGTNTTLTTLEDTPYTFTGVDFGFTDPNDSPGNNLAAVKITTLPTAGSLRKDGAAVTAGQFITAADLDAGLLQFSPVANASGAPHSSFTFQVQDDGGTANGGINLDASANTLTINVTAVNDAPAGTNKTVTTLEDTAYTFTVADFGFSDTADTPANTLQAIEINSLPTAGALMNNGVALGAGDYVSAADIASGLLKFSPAANANGATYATFTFQVQDNGGTANGGVDLDPSPNTITVAVTPVNDAPTGSDKTLTALEDTVYTFSAADFEFADPDDMPPNALSAVVVTTLASAGTLRNNGSLVVAGQVISVANINSGWFTYTPAANVNGAGVAAFTFQVRDNGGVTNGGVNQDRTARTLTFDVTAVNDAPSGTNNSVTTLEDTPYTLTTADFGFTDPNDSPGNNLAAVKITTLATAGSLRKDGVAVTAGQFITAAELDAGLLQFLPVANASGAPHSSFTFQVQDDGGIANGGINLDASANTLTINVTAVNDAPAGTNKTVTTLEDTAYTFTVADFGFSDPLDSPANQLLAVEIVSLPTVGVLTRNGVALGAGDFVSAVDIASGLLKFWPAANGNGAAYATFTFQVQDNGGTAIGGVDLDPSPNTITVAVTPVNDAPAGSGKIVTALEDTVYTFSAADFGFLDPDDVPPNALSAVVVTTLPSAGTLRNNGSLVVAGQIISVANINSGLFTYTPASNVNGANIAAFTFQVRDNGGVANGGVNQDRTPRTLSFDVTAVNDAPTGADTTVSTLEDTPYYFTVADFGFQDANDTPANNFLAVKIATVPLSGSLTLGGVLVTQGQIVQSSDIAAGRFAYVPTANVNGSGVADFLFQVIDDGGTANGGADTDVSPHTNTMTIIAVNDPPAGTDATVTIWEDTPYAFAVTDFGFSDPLDSPANQLLAVTITTTPAAGALTYRGAPVTAGISISAADIAAGALTFMPAANANGASYAHFTFQVQDDGGTTDGGVDLDPTPATMTIDVTPVNDAPSGGDKSIAVQQNGYYTLTAADFGFVDAVDSPANRLGAVRIASLPARGTLTNHGVAVAAGQFVTVSDITAGQLRFAPELGGFGNDYALFTFQVQDDGGTARGGVDLDQSPNTIRFNVKQLFDPNQILVIGSDAGTLSQPVVKVVYGATGGLIVRLTAYETTYTGGVRAVIGDVTGDGVPEIITAPGRSHTPLIKVFDIRTGAMIYQFMADAATFVDGLSLAVGDVNGDGRNDIVTAANRGAATVKVFENRLSSGGGFVQTRSFDAFGDYVGYQGGASAAVGDLDGTRDGNSRADIVVASGAGIAAMLRVFDVTTSQTKYVPTRQILDPNSAFRGGLSVTLGDVDGDGILDLISGAGLSGGSLVRVYNGNAGAGNAPLSTFTAFTDASRNAALRVVAKDIDGSGRTQVYVAQGVGGANNYQVRRFRPLTGELVDSVFAADPAFTGGGLNLG